MPWEALKPCRCSRRCRRRRSTGQCCAVDHDVAGARPGEHGPGKGEGLPGGRGVIGQRVVGLISAARRREGTSWCSRPPKPSDRCATSLPVEDQPPEVDRELTGISVGRNRDREALAGARDIGPGRRASGRGLVAIGPCQLERCIAVSADSATADDRVIADLSTALGLFGEFGPVCPVRSSRRGEIRSGEVAETLRRSARLLPCWWRVRSR